MALETKRPIGACLLIVAAAAIWVVYRSPENSGRPALEELTIGGATIHFERLTTPAAFARGLSGRQSLPQGQGLFFPFARDDYHGIWMKDMLFPIDIIWFDSTGCVVHIEHAAQPESYPHVFKPSVVARSVLEVNSGFAALYGVEVGTTCAILDKNVR
jgi:uncharacterized protein